MVRHPQGGGERLPYQVQGAVTLREEEKGHRSCNDQDPGRRRGSRRICASGAAIPREEERGPPLLTTQPQGGGERLRISLDRSGPNLVRRHQGGGGCRRQFTEAPGRRKARLIREFSVRRRRAPKPPSAVATGTCPGHAVHGCSATPFRSASRDRFCSGRNARPLR